MVHRPVYVVYVRLALPPENFRPFTGDGLWGGERRATGDGVFWRSSDALFVASHDPHLEAELKPRRLLQLGPHSQLHSCDDVTVTERVPYYETAKNPCNSSSTFAYEKQFLVYPLTPK